MKSKEFLAIFEADLFHPGLTATTRDTVLAEMVEFLHRKRRVNSRQTVLNTLLEREKLGSTGIGKGVAIPHSRSMMVERLTVLFSSVPGGVDFQAIDKKPVYLVFLILAPPQDVGNQYLPFIGKLVEVVKEKKNRDALKAAGSFEVLLEVMRQAS